MNNLILKNKKINVKKSKNDFDESFNFWKKFFPELENNEDLFFESLVSLGEDLDKERLFEIYNKYRDYEYCFESNNYNESYIEKIEDTLKLMDSKIFGWGNFYKPILMTNLYYFYNNLLNKNCIFDPIKIFEKFVINITMTIFQISHRILIVETNNCREKKLLKGKDEKERADYFKNKMLANEKYLLQVYNTYPVLIKNMEDKINKISDFILSIIDNYEKTKNILSSSWNNNISFGKIVDFIYGAGDTHNNGKSVTIIQFEKGKLVYKPRNLNVEVKYNLFIDALNHKKIQNFLELKYVDVLNFGDFGWCKYIATSQCESAEDVKNYYIRIGELLSIYYLLGSTDFHAENIIANGSYPIIIDTETLFSIGLIEKEIIDKSVANYIGNEISNSVKSSAILPIKIRNKKLNKHVDLSGLSMDEKQLSPFKSNFIKNPNSDQISIVSEFSYIENSKNMVIMNNALMSSNDYISEILYGFQNTYIFFINNKEYVKDLIDKYFKNVEFRVIFRDTMTYSQILSSSYHPDLNQFFIDKEIYVNRLALNTKKEFNNIIKSEHYDILNDDIPFFKANTTKNHVVDSRENKIFDIVKETAFSRILSKLNRMSEKDLAIQKKIINYSYSEWYKNSIFKTNYKFGTANKNKFERDEALEIVKLIAKIVEKYSFTVSIEDGLHRSWIGYIEVEDNYRQTSPVGLNLYDGNIGVSLLFSCLYKATGNSHYKTVAEEIIRPVISYLNEFDANTEAQNGFYNGYFGTLYVLLETSKILKNNNYYDKVIEVLNKLTPKNAISKYNDIIVGNAGALLFYTKLREELKNIESVDININAILSKVKKYVIKQDKFAYIGKEGYTGYAHGTAGISHLLYEISKLNDDNELMNLSLAMLRYERKKFNKKNKNFEKSLNDNSCHIKWCHGIPGILLNRLYFIENGYSDDYIMTEVNKGIELIEQKGFGDNFCLCHGDFGNLMILLKTSKILKDEELKEQIFLETIKLAHIIKEKIENDEQFIDNVGFGLMTGLSGVGYAILYLLYDELNFPNILGI